MTKILEAVHLDDPASLKRFLVMAIGAGMVVATPFLARYGISEPTPAEIAGFVTIVCTFLAQSGAKSIAAASAAGKVAAAQVDSVAKADAVIAEASKPVAP